MCNVIRLYFCNCKVYEVDTGTDIGWGCRCSASWCYLELTFDLAVVTLTCKILPGQYLSNCKMQEVDS